MTIKMNKKTLKLLRFLEKHPEHIELVKSLLTVPSHPVDIMLPEAELKLDVVVPELTDTDFDDGILFRTAASSESKIAVTAHPSPGTTKVTIRIPNEILVAFKSRAAAEKTPYQTLVVQALRDVVDSKGATSSL